MSAAHSQTAIFTWPEHMVRYNPQRRQRDDDTIMSLLNALSLLAPILLLLFILYRANWSQVTGESPRVLHTTLYVLLAFVLINIVTLVLEAALPPAYAGRRVQSNDAVLISIVGLPLIAICTLAIASAPARVQIGRLLRGYNPASPVHMTALVLCSVLMLYTLSGLVMDGGTAGLAENIETSGVGFIGLVLNQILWVMGAALGAGLWLRRSPGDIMRRLGLRLPTSADLALGGITGLVGVGFILIFGILSSVATSPQSDAAQAATSRAILGTFGTLPLAFLMAALVAIGEEIFFRGALHPVFGNLVTSVFFVALHTQYALSPATLGLLIVSLGFGWLRTHYSTTAAIIAHFVYNFVQLALAILAGSLLESMPTP